MDLVGAAAIALAYLLAWQWRRRTGFRLRRRERAATVPSRDVRVFLPPYERRSVRLVTSPGKVELDAYWRSKRIMCQTSGPVIEVYARFAPPWRRRGFVIRDESAWCGVYGPARVIKLTREEIAAAGFEIVEVTTRFRRFPVSPRAFLASETEPEPGRIRAYSG